MDQTGLTDRLDFTLKYTPDASQLANLPAALQPPADDPDAPPDLFTAVQQQLGLKIESTKAPVGVMVIDKIEKTFGQLILPSYSHCIRSRPFRKERSVPCRRAPFWQ